MNEDQKVMIRESFAKIVPISTAAADLFYGRLFELDPTLRPMFKGDIMEQGRKLMATIGFAVANLSEPNTLLPAVRKLGERHVAYGVKVSHYDTVGEALLWTLGKGLGDAFTPSLRESWAECYGFLAGVMKEAANTCRNGDVVHSGGHMRSEVESHTS